MDTVKATEKQKKTTISRKIKMPRPKPPNRSEPSPFPVFGASWFAGNGTSVVAFCGGGGSARTGVNNAIVVLWNDEPPLHLSTGTDVAIAVKVFEVPGTIRLLVGLEKRVEYKGLPNGEDLGTIEVGHRVEAVQTNAERLAIGCENGMVFEYKLSPDNFSTSELLHCYEGHENAICALDFSVRNQLLLSSAKDGTARVWQNGVCKDVLKNVVLRPQDPPPKRKMQVMVRGCAFLDLEGNDVVTVASAKRGNAFLTRWKRNNKKLETETHMLIHNFPVSSMSMSMDAQWLALGTVDGSVKLFDLAKFKVKKVFSEVHGLPVTSIAARPFGLPLPGEDDGIQVQARSFSADGQSWCLTLQTRVPKSQQQYSGGSSIWLDIILRILQLSLWALVLSPLTHEVQGQWLTCRQQGILGMPRCLWEQVVWAPQTRPGVASWPQ